MPVSRRSASMRGFDIARLLARHDFARYAPITILPACFLSAASGSEGRRLYGPARRDDASRRRDIFRRRSPLQPVMQRRGITARSFLCLDYLRQLTCATDDAEIR